MQLIYSKNRQNPCDNAKDFERYLKELVNIFGQDWLQSESDNPLQVLWKRRDALASSELVTLGLSLLRIKDINPSWIKKNIKLIKETNPNNRRGAVLEIIAGNILHNPPLHKVKFPAIGTPGYDMVVQLQDSSEIFVSIKNYGRSKHIKLVFEQSALIEELIKRNLNKRSLQIINIKTGKYPDPSDWEVLKRHIPEILEKEGTWTKIGHDWEIGVSKLKITKGTLYPGKSSYSFLLFAPFHKNEELNLYSKLDEACCDLNRHGKSESENSLNIVYMRIPEEMSLELCVEWSKEYFKNHPQASISGVLFHQPSVVRDQNKNASHIAHVNRFVTKTGIMNNWFEKNGRRLKVVYPVGIPQQKSTIQTLHINDSVFQLNRYCIYQSGHIYLHFKRQKGHKLTANLSINFGIHTHAIISNGDKELMLSGIFPPKHELLLI